MTGVRRAVGRASVPSHALAPARAGRPGPGGSGVLELVRESARPEARQCNLSPSSDRRAAGVGQMAEAEARHHGVGEEWARERVGGRRPEDELLQ